MPRPDDPPATETETPSSLHARRSLLRPGFMTACAVSAGALLVLGGLVLMPADDVDERPDQASPSQTAPLADDGPSSGARNRMAFQGDTAAAGREIGDGDGSPQPASQDTAPAGDATEQVGTERRSDAGNRTRPVPLDRVDIDVNRPVEPALGRAGTAADELHRRGRLGDDDTLAPAGPAGRLGSRVLTRTRQEHHGIPVFAAEVVVTTEGERIVKIHGHPAPGIDLATTSPAHEYPAAVTLAENVLRHDIAPHDDGLLVIVAVEGGYRLAWLGVVVIDRGPEQVAFDAETGKVLHRAPVVRHAAAAAAAGEGGR